MFLSLLCCRKIRWSASWVSRTFNWNYHLGGRTVLAERTKFVALDERCIWHFPITRTFFDGWRNVTITRKLMSSKKIRLAKHVTLFDRFDCCGFRNDGWESFRLSAVGQQLAGWSLGRYVDDYEVVINCFRKLLNKFFRPLLVSGRLTAYTELWQDSFDYHCSH